MKKASRLDVSQYCEAIHRNRPRQPTTSRFVDGFIVDNAERPASWSRLDLGVPSGEQQTVVKLTSITAETVHEDARDDLDTSAPGLLRASYGHKEWFNSPETVLTYERRAAYREGNRFPFNVVER